MSTMLAMKTSLLWSEVETYLANQIEFPANAVIKKIRNRETITTIDKLKFSNLYGCHAQTGS